MNVRGCVRLSLTLFYWMERMSDIDTRFVGMKRSDRSRFRTEDIGRMVADINRMPLMLRRRTQLSVDGEIGRIIIKVIDTETDTVIKEIPPSKLQEIYRNIRKNLDILDGR